MRRAIYEDDVIKLLDKGWKSGVYPVASNIHALPSAQPEREKGTYKESGENDEWYCWYATCNECGDEWMGSRNFCPNCGRMMKGKENG